MTLSVRVIYGMCGNGICGREGIPPRLAAAPGGRRGVRRLPRPPSRIDAAPLPPRDAGRARVPRPCRLRHGRCSARVCADVAVSTATMPYARAAASELLESTPRRVYGGGGGNGNGDGETVS